MVEIAPSGKRLRILQLLLDHGELTGAELLDLDDSLPRGTIYTTLRRLQDDKLVTSRQEVDKGQPGPPRRLYKITAFGMRAAKLGEYAQAVMSGARSVAIPRGRL